jgi:hypothetical protein
MRVKLLFDESFGDTDVCHKKCWYVIPSGVECVADLKRAVVNKFIKSQDSSIEFLIDDFALLEDEVIYIDILYIILINL